MPAVHCTRHPQELAAWRCRDCARALCEHCAYAADSGAHRHGFARCVHCGGAGEIVLTVPDRRPWFEVIGPFLKSVFSPLGLAQLLSLAIVVFLLHLIPVPIVFVLIALGARVAFFLMVTRKAAEGSTRLPVVASEDMGSALGGLAGFILATAIIWVPLWIHFANAAPGTAAGFVLDPTSDPVALIITLIGWVYVPAAFIMAAMSHNILNTINPVAVISLMSRIPTPYLLTAFVWGLIHYLDSWLTIPLLKLQLAIGVPVLAPILTITLSLILPVISFFILGRLVFRCGPELGFATDSELARPQLPGARPAGETPPDARPVGTSRPDLLASPPAPDDGYLDLAAPNTELPPAARLKEAVAAGDAADAVEAWREIAAEGFVEEIPAYEELRVAQWLAGMRLPREAAVAFQRAGRKDPEDPLTAEAMLGYARLLGENGRLDQAADVLRNLVARFPREAAADEARRWLSELA